MRHGGSSFVDPASGRPGVATRVAPLHAVVGTLIGALVVGNAQAQGVGATAPAAPLPSPLSAMMQGLVGLVVVVGVIVAAGWLLKKLGPRTRPAGAVQVVGAASVGPREKVVVVRFGGQTLLLGVAPGQVSLLHSAPSTEPADALVPTGTTRFVDRLRAARSGA